MSFMVGHRLASQSPSFPTHTAQPSRRTAPISRFPRTKLPPVADYARACAALIWATFPASSQNAVCERAERELCIASADTFARILSGHTKSPAGHLMQCVMVVAASRGVKIPDALVVRGQG